MSAVAAVKEMQGFIFIGANQPFEHPHMEIEVRGSSTASADAIVHFGSVGRLCGLSERSKAT